MLEFLLCIVSWRLTYMITYEDAPMAVFKRFRRLLKPEDGTLCFSCVSVWVGAFLSLFTYNPFLFFLVLSSAAIFINLLHERLDG